MPFKLAVIVNKTTGELRPSETFLHAHINKMPCEVYSLVGNPGYRIVRERYKGDGKYLVSRSLLPLGYRWFNRRLFGQSVDNQDVRALIRFLRNNSIDAVLAEYGITAVSVMKACHQANIPLIAQFHGFDAYRESLVSDLASSYRELFRVSAAIVGVSRHMCDHLISLGAPKYKVFHNACGAEIPSDQDSSNAMQSSPRFLMVGRLVDKKAPFVSLLAFSKLVGDVPGVELEIVGDGPLKSPCMQLVRALGIEHRVVFSGTQSHSYVLQAMGQARCFIQHSVRAPDGDMEGTPVGVLEAMGMGLPVISTRHGGISDIVKEKITGVLVDEYDAESMYLAMKNVAESPELAKEMGQRAKESVLANWTSEQSVSRLWEIIEKVSKH